VASVAIFTRRDPRDIRTIAMDRNSRTSVALATVILKNEFRISATPVALEPDIELMLGEADAALIIGDNALFLDHAAHGVHKIDLGEVWTKATGLPFVYAFWAGWPHVVSPADAHALQLARDAGVEHVEDIARRSFPGDPRRQAVTARYLRDNIQYFLGAEEFEGLQTFYRYAAELRLVPPFDGELRIYHADDSGVR
jgi:chorismate dehydratase